MNWQSRGTRVGGIGGSLSVPVTCTAEAGNTNEGVVLLRVDTETSQLRPRNTVQRPGEGRASSNTNHTTISLPEVGVVLGGDTVPVWLTSRWREDLELYQYIILEVESCILYKVADGECAAIDDS